MDLMSSSSVARRLGISSERVRQLERAGDLIVAQRTELGRLFDPESVEALANLRAALRPTGGQPDASDAESSHEGDMGPQKPNGAAGSGMVGRAPVAGKRPVD